jgi:hypothetical protein
MVVAVSFIFLPMVISSVTPIVNNQAVANDQIPNCDLAPATATQPAIPGKAVPAGTSAASFAAENPASVSFAQKNAALLSKISANYRVIAAATAPGATALDQAKVLVALGPADTVKALALKPQIDKLVNPYACQLNYLSAHQVQLADLQKNLAKSPKQWQHWFWIDVAGMIVFIPFIFMTKGRWSPRKARKDLEDNERRVAEELAALGKS